MVLMSAARRALWVTPVSDLGGVARHVLDVGRVGLPGWELVALCPPGPLADRLAGAGVPTTVSRFGPAWGPATSVRALREAVARFEPAVVHTHLAFADVVAATLRRGRWALVSTEHGIAGVDALYHRTKASATTKALLHRWRVRRFDALIAVSEATRRAMVQKWKPNRSIRVIVNGIDAEPGTECAGNPVTAVRVVALGRLAPEKRFDALLAAFAELRRYEPEATLTIAGEGPLRDSLLGLAARLGCGEAVRFPGFVDASRVLAESDVLAQLSYWENMSYSVLDAIAHGVGVVAAPVGGNPEVLPDQCLVDPSDPVAVAERLQRQARDHWARPSLPASWPTVAEMTAQIADVYEQVVAGVRV